MNVNESTTPLLLREVLDLDTLGGVVLCAACVRVPVRMESPSDSSLALSETCVCNNRCAHGKSAVTLSALLYFPIFNVTFKSELIALNLTPKASPECTENALGIYIWVRDMLWSSLLLSAFLMFSRQYFFFRESLSHKCERAPLVRRITSLTPIKSYSCSVCGYILFSWYTNVGHMSNTSSACNYRTVGTVRMNSWRCSNTSICTKWDSR